MYRLNTHLPFGALMTIILQGQHNRMVGGLVLPFTAITFPVQNPSPGTCSKGLKQILNTEATLISSSVPTLLGFSSPVTSGESRPLWVPQDPSLIFFTSNRLRLGAVRKAVEPRRGRVRDSWEELPHIRGQGRQLRGATPRPRSSGCTGAGDGEELLHIQGQEGPRHRVGHY